MKKKNCFSEFNDHRNKVLIENFKAALAMQSRFSLEKAFHAAANSPAPRFWVSESRAEEVVRRHLAGKKPLETMHANKALMFGEIIRRVKAFKASNPGCSLADAVTDVVNSPAPSSFLTPDYARKLITANRKRHDR